MKLVVIWLSEGVMTDYKNKMIIRTCFKNLYKNDDYLTDNCGG